MAARKRGICLIINNYDFSKSEKYLQNREGTMLDQGAFAYIWKCQLKHACRTFMYFYLSVSSRVSVQSV